MRVMTSGGTGFIGSHTAVALVAAGHEVRLLARSREKVARVFAAHDLPAPDCVIGDITDAAAVGEAMAGCDAAVHAAGLVALEAKHAETVIETNLRGVEVVVGGACERGIGSVLYVSSAASLFVPGMRRLDVDAPPPTPKSGYGRAKADAERFVRGLQDRGGPIVTSYPTAVIGPLDPGLSQSNHAVVTQLRDVFLNTSSGFQIIDVRDLAQMHVRMLESAPAPGRYLAAGRFFPWRELGDLLDLLTEGSLRRITVPGAVLRVAGRVCDQVKRIRDFDFPLTLEAMNFATRWPEVDGSEALRKLGLELRDPHETLTDLLRWLVRAGHLRPDRIGPLAEA